MCRSSTGAKDTTRDTLTSDLVAAVIVTIMLIPQSLAYALLAGLPAEMGLYASILPLVAYAIFGTSRALAVGPVAVVSLMTAAAIGNLGLTDPAEIAAAAITLAFLSGLILLAMGVFRLGFLANFLSHPVIAGFITASGILIATSQLKHILGVSASGHTLPELLHVAWLRICREINLPTLVIGVAATGFLFWVRKGLKRALLALGLGPRMADILTKAGPVAAVAVTTLVTWGLGLADWGVRIVGDVPHGLPPLTLPSFDLDLWTALIGSAAADLGHRLRRKRLGRADPCGQETPAHRPRSGTDRPGCLQHRGRRFRRLPGDRWLRPLGGQLRRRRRNPRRRGLHRHRHRRRRPGPDTADLLPAQRHAGRHDHRRGAVAGRFLDPANAAWTYSRADFTAVAATILLTLGFGVEVGVSAGVLISILLYLYRTSRPHIAEVGLVPGTEHFRNINRHKVLTDPKLLTHPHRREPVFRQCALSGGLPAERVSWPMAVWPTSS